MRLKAMTYNLLYGGHEREGNALVFQQDRAEAARQVIAGQAPDVLALTEAVYCGVGGRLIRPDYARQYGLPHLYTDGYEGEWASCLLSRWPIVAGERLPLGGSGDRAQVSALRATLDCDGRRLHVDVVHPSPKITEAERAQAFAPLLATFSRPYLLLGDFNALSDEDPYTHETLTAELTGNVPDPAALATRMLDRQLIANVRAAGLRDTMAPAARTATIPTRLPRPGATQGARLRLDYVFVSAELGVEGAAVITGEAADRASDHYPVIAELTLG